MALAGNLYRSNDIKNKIHKELNSDYYDLNIFKKVSELYECNIIVIVQDKTSKSHILPIKEIHYTKYIYIRKKDEKIFYALNIKRKPRSSPKKISKLNIIMTNKRKTMKANLKNSQFHVTYEDDTEDTFTLFQFKNIKGVFEIIQREIDDENIKKLLIELITIDIENSGVHDGTRNTYVNHRRKYRKKFTGKAMTEIIREDMKGKGGCYCFMPYATVDKRENAIFKVGMTNNFERRADQYHTYFPGGVYMVAFLANPPLVEWDKNVHYSNLIVSKRKDLLYREIENYIFQYIVKNKGNRIFSTTRVNFKNKNDDNKGATEWFHCNEDIIHNAFDEAKNKYGGEIRHFYLEGINSNNGEIVSINNTAKEQKMNLPNYTGEIIFKV